MDEEEGERAKGKWEEKEGEKGERGRRKDGGREEGRREEEREPTARSSHAVKRVVHSLVHMIPLSYLSNPLSCPSYPIATPQRYTLAALAAIATVLLL